MKLLFEETDRQEVDRIRILLESRGIPVFIGNEETARNFGFIALSQKYGVWVFEDSQFGCAKKILADETHEVEKPIDVNEYYRLTKEDNAIDIHSFMWKKIVLPLVVFVIFLVAVITVLFYLEA